jgi:hypothetical protein
MGRKLRELLRIELRVGGPLFHPGGDAQLACLVLAFRNTVSAASSAHQFMLVDGMTARRQLQATRQQWAYSSRAAEPVHMVN